MTAYQPSVRPADYGRGAATAYRRGTYREKKSATYLRGEGYFVLESRGSHGCADLVAVKFRQVLLVQVKSGDVHDSATGLADAWWNELYWSARHVGAIPLLADTPKRGVLRFRRLMGEHELHSAVWWLEPFVTDEAAETAARGGA
jgi:Holliday junction resolvase